MIVEANGVDVILPDTSQAREVGCILSDVVLSSKEEFEEYFLEDSEKTSSYVEEEICDHCGSSSKHWNKNLINDSEIDVEEIDKFFEV